MQWSDAIQPYVQALKPIAIDTSLKRRIMRLIDYTSLNESDTDDIIIRMFDKAQTANGQVAALCVYPQFISLVANQCAASGIKAATVVNFPDGHASLEQVLAEISQSLQAGAQEIDVVFPYQSYLAGDYQYAGDFVMACKAACGTQAILKVILETGVLNDLGKIAQASYIALSAGADFIKTSTGKVEQGASLEAAAVMLLVIKRMQVELKRPLGLKISGGIRELEQAAQYIALADAIMSPDWVNTHTFRIGASRLLESL